MLPKKEKVSVDMGLSDEDRAELHKIARAVIEHRSRGQSIPRFSPSSARLNEGSGAFVCVYKKGMLRGCIGSLEGDTPLYKTVKEMAEAAAFRDPRFRPVTEDELPYLDIELSVLTPLKRIEKPEEIEVGRHGILIRKGYYSGLLLPQVAAERDWDRVTFLRETCRKAGLPMDAWKETDAEIYIFSADVF